MEWCFQENKDYASMHRKRSQKLGWDKRTSEGDQDNSKSESRSEEEVGGQQSMSRNVEQPNERKKRGFAIQIKNNDPIIFDDDSVSTLTHYDRRSRRESGDLSDMLGPFQHGSTGRILAAEVEANRIQEGEAVVYNVPTDTEQDAATKPLNSTLSRQQKLNRAKHRFKVKEVPSLLSLDSGASTSVRSARCESIAQKVAMFEKPNHQKTTSVKKAIQTKKKAFLSTQANSQRDQSTPAQTKSLMSTKVPESNGVTHKRPSLGTSLRNGTSERSARSISSCLKNEKSTRSEKSSRSVTFCDEDTELGPQGDSPVYDIPAADSNLSASECKRSLSLKYKKSRVSREERKLKHLNNQNPKTADKNDSSFFGVKFAEGCPFDFNFDFDFDDFDISNFDIKKFDISMLLGAFDCFGRNKYYDLTQSFDEDRKEEEMAEEETKDFSGGEIATELVEFPQPKWSKRMAASE
ncbi:MAG: hypothetical protein SGBAC_000340 [Bacillariaceae sp.]